MLDEFVCPNIPYPQIQWLKIEYEFPISSLQSSCKYTVLQLEISHCICIHIYMYDICIYVIIYIYVYNIYIYRCICKYVNM